MRRFAILLVLAACPKTNEPTEPTPPPVADASIDAQVDEAPPPTPPSTAILAASYPQNCTRDDECVGVFEGNACNPCRCAFNAIRSDALVRYKADLGQYWACHKPEDCKTECAQQIGAAAKCEAGTCILPP